MTTAPARSGFTHRPALDGLRALAVVAVIVFHLGYPWAVGGFLGVDVFFVLSGYLITSLLLAERARTGRVDLRAFWARRARRLLPALVLMGSAILVAAPLTMTAEEFGMVRWDGLATAFYVANWRFASAGEPYFAQFGDPSPLWHLWSLAVEEQFYLVWPLLLLGLCALAARRRAAHRDLPLIATCAIGIAGSALMLALLYTPGGDPSRAYFGTDARIHEPLVGAVLAVVLHRRRLQGMIPGPRAVRAARLLGPAAAVVLVACLATLDSHAAPYYRGGSLVTAAAVAGLILACEWSPPGHLLTRALSLRPVRYVGRLSYGLYLWHWPVLIWLSGDHFGPGGPARDALKVGVTLLVAAASYHLVETPIRRGSWRRPALAARPRPAQVARRPVGALTPGHLRLR